MNKTRKLQHIFEENKYNESGNDLIKTMMNNSLYSVGAIQTNFETSSRNFDPKYSQTDNNERINAS